MNPNSRVSALLRQFAEFLDQDTFAENWGRLADPLADDKRELELSHPRIIEAELDEEYGGAD